MSLTAAGVLAVIAMLVLMGLGVPVAIAMIVPALIGIVLLTDAGVLAAVVDGVIANHGISFTLATIPLFVLMGEVLHESGLTGRIYGAVRAWFGRLRGGLALSSVGASAVFAAASGSSVATTSTMGVVASEEMLDAGYDQRLVSGSIVAGGGLGILIPPSTLLILYGTLTQESIGSLLVAGLLPGLVLTALLMLTIGVIVTVRPSAGAGVEPVSWSAKLASLVPIGWIGVLFVLVMGSLYGGWTSPTEAAAVGALGAIVIGVVRGGLSLAGLGAAVARSVRTTGFIFAIILGSFLLNYLLAITRIADHLAGLVGGLDAPRGLVFVAIVLLFLVLGAFMDAFAMVVITVPIIVPLVEALGFDTIWFGIVLVLLVEIALITPPVGMNNFILHGVAPRLAMARIMQGALIFCIPLLAMILLLYLFPEIALWLPGQM